LDGPVHHSAGFWQWTGPSARFYQCWTAVDGPVHHSAKKPPIDLKSVSFDNDIMEIGLIYSNLFEKRPSIMGRTMNLRNE
jgi:hypothetical protein